MKILLDENIPTKVATNFGKEFEVKTVRDMRWLGKKNGELLGLMTFNGFDFFITVDKNLKHQQNLEKFDITIFLLCAKDNKHQTLQPFIDKVQKTLTGGHYKKFNEIRLGPIGFTNTINMKLDIAIGFLLLINLQPSCSFAQGAWVKKANFAGTPRVRAVGFSIGAMGYIGIGYYNGSNLRDFWEYDVSSNSWAQKANFKGIARNNAVGISIGNKGYIGTGADTICMKDFWEYDPSSNIWTQKADFGGIARQGAVGFSIGAKGYIGTGSDNFAYCQDFWEYDTSADTWSKKTDFGFIGIAYTVAFTIGTKGYVGTGNDFNDTQDFWEYDPSQDTWTQKANFGGVGRRFATGFSIGTKGYIGTGRDDNSYFKDFWEYDPFQDTWTQKANFGGNSRHGDIGFCIGGKGYIGTGYGGNYEQDFWEFDPTVVDVNELIYSPDISFFQNPSSRIFKIHNQVNGICNIEVYNVLGEKIFYATFSHQLLINLSSQPDGIYFMVAKANENVIQSKKIILE